MTMVPDVRCEWVGPGSAVCGDAAMHLIRFQIRHHAQWYRYVCTAHHHEGAGRAPSEFSSWPLVLDARSVSLFCGALSGWLVDPVLRDLLAAHVAGDEAAGIVALDLAEQRGLHEGRWERVEVEWPRADAHEHVWLKWVRGDESRAFVPVAIAPGLIRRCPCGMFEHEHDGALLRRTVAASVRASLEERLEALVRSNVCDDEQCDMPRGHAGDHYTRWDAGHGNIGEESWSDEDRFACTDCGTNGHGYHVCPGRLGENDGDDASA